MFLIKWQGCCGRSWNSVNSIVLDAFILFCVWCVLFLEYHSFSLQKSDLDCSTAKCLIAGMVGSRGQGQVTSSSEIGLGNGQGQPGQAMGQVGQAGLGQGQGQGQQPTKDVTPDIVEGLPNNPLLKCTLCAQRLEDTHFVQVCHHCPPYYIINI